MRGFARYGRDYFTFPCYLRVNVRHLFRLDVISVDGSVSVSSYRQRFEIIVCCLVPVSLLQVTHCSVSVCECVKEWGGWGHGVTGVLLYCVSVYRVCVRVSV